MDNLLSNIDLTGIYTIAEEIATKYKQNLESEGINASGALSDSVDHWDVDFDGQTFQITLNLEQYWYYVENGRKPGKMPPIKVIKDWIQVKRIVPRPLRGKVPSPDQLAFLIARKIGRDGIPAKHILERTIQETDISSRVTQVIVNGINEIIENDLRNLNK